MAGDRSTILLVTTSELFAQSIGPRLEESGYRVVLAADESAALAEMSRALPSLILVDRQFAHHRKLCQNRTLRAVPIVAFQAPPLTCSEEACIEDLERGMDDSVCNQSFRQLLARIRAILRRHQVAQESPPLLRIGDIVMDLDRHEVIVRGRQVDLTPKEFQILRCFVESPNRVFSRQEMLDRVWGQGYALEAHALDVHIHSLRQKIELFPARPQFIVTVRGLGYKLRASSP